MLKMNEILRPAQKGERAEEGLERHVVVNLRKGIVLSKAPIMSWPFSGIRYFLVRNENHAHGMVTFDDFFHRGHLLGHRGTLGFRLSGQVSCISGMEEKLALALGKYPDAQKGLDHQLRLWTDAFCKNLEEEHVVRYEEVALWLARELSEQAREIGLNMSVEAMIEEQDQYTDLSLKLEINTFLHGSDGEFKLWLDLDTELSGRNAAILSTRPALHKTLEKRITSKIKELMRGKISPSTYYYERKGKLKRLAIEALEPILQDAGLAIIRLEITGENPPLPEGQKQIVEFRSSPLVGGAEKYKVKLYLKLALTITRIETFVDAARNQSPEEIATQEIEKAVTAIVEVMEISDVGSPGNLREKIQNMCAVRMAHLGIESHVLGFSVETPNLTLVPFFEEEIEITYRLFGSGEQIPFKSKVQMSLVDKNLFFRAGCPDLKSWNEEKLNLYLRRELFDFDYPKLVVNFQNQVPNRIETAIKEEARKIGYYLDILTVLPDLKPLLWKEYFQVNISGPFPTIVPSCQVELQILVRMCIPELGHEELKKYINRNDDIQPIIEDEVRELLQPFFHNLSPEHYYTQFDTLQIGDPNSKEPVKDLIRNEVERILIEKFRAEIDTISIKQLDTDLSNHLRDFEKENPDITFEFEPRDVNEVLTFSGRLKVSSVDPEGWSTFQNSIHKNIDDLVLAVKSHVTRPMNELPCKSFTHHRDALIRKIQDLIDECSFQEFGLRVELLNLGRTKSEAEIANAKLVKEDLEFEYSRRRLAIQEKRKDLEHFKEVSDQERNIRKRTHAELLELINAKTLANTSTAERDIAILQERLEKTRPKSLLVQPKHGSWDNDHPSEGNPLAALDSIKTKKRLSPRNDRSIESGSATRELEAQSSQGEEPTNEN